MGDSDQNETGSRPSTRFRWNYGSKEGREVFGLETTINGDPTDAELGGDIASVIKALGSCFAAAVALANHNRDTAESGAITTVTSTASSDQTGPYHWIRGRTGKSILVLQGNMHEPSEIECPIHPGKMMTRRENEGGSWLTHTDGDTFCTTRIEATFMLGARKRWELT